MSQDETGSADDVISVKDMRSALQKEIQIVMKAADLRIREMAKLTEAYVAGEISPSEATERYMHHLDKWGDPLPGVTRAAHILTDEQISADMERALDSHTSRIREKPQQRGIKVLPSGRS